MKTIEETDDGMIVHLTWEEYKAIRSLSEGWDDGTES